MVCYVEGIHDVIVHTDSLRLIGVPQRSIQYDGRKKLPVCS